VTVTLDNGELGKQDIVTTCPNVGFLGETKCTNTGLQYSDNFWRDGLTPTNEEASEWDTHQSYAVDNQTLFYQCAHQCSVHPKTGRITCDEGSAGVLCSQCAPDFYAGSSGQCVQCAHLTTETLTTIVVIILLVALFVGTSIAYRRQWCQESAFLRSALGKIQRFWQHAVATNLKFFITFFQMVLLFRYVYQLTFPSLYLDFLAAFSFVNLNIFELFQVLCVFGSINFDTRMYVLGTVLLVMEMAVTLVRSKTGKALSRVQNILNILIFLLYPSVSSMLFQVHNCRRIYGVSYLHADYSIECDSSGHRSAAAYSILLIVLVAIGIPALYLRLLSPHRHDIMKGSTESSRHLGFMYNDYKPRLWFWEVVVITLKLVMTGFAVWFAPGSLMQIIIGMLVLLVYVQLLNTYKPYRSHTHNGLAVFQTLMVFLSLFASLLLKIGDVVSSSNIDLGYSTGFITAALITVAVAILISSVLGAVRDYQLSILYVVVSTPEFSYPPAKKEQYDAGSYVQALGDKWRVSQAGGAGGYTLKRVYKKKSNAGQTISADDIDGEVQPVMEIVEGLCHARADMIFGYDWKGSSSGDVRDHHGSFRRREVVLGDVASTAIEVQHRPVNFRDQDEIADSYLFKGYCDSVRAEVKTLCQMPHVAKVVLVCIEGGTFTQLEEATMRGLAEEARADLKTRHLEPNVEVLTLAFEDFLTQFKRPFYSKALQRLQPQHNEKQMSDDDDSTSDDHDNESGNSGAQPTANPMVNPAYDGGSTRATAKGPARAEKAERASGPVAHAI
jgi:hypothetical protein